jgi:hypothetical protein
MEDFGEHSRTVHFEDQGVVGAFQRRPRLGGIRIPVVMEQENGGEALEG